MKQIQAYVHRSRMADVIAAFKGSNAWDTGVAIRVPSLAVHIVKGLSGAADNDGVHYSIELGDAVVNVYKLELVCEDAHLDELLDIVRSTGRTEQTHAGWVVVTNVDAFFMVPS